VIDPFKNIPSYNLITMQNFGCCFSYRVSRIGVKFFDNGTYWDGAWLTPRNTPSPTVPPKLVPLIKPMGVRTEIRRKWVIREVTQGHQNRHGSIGYYNFLLVIQCCCPDLFRSRDRDLGHQVSRPRPRPRPGQNELKCTRVSETMVSTSQHC